MFVCNRWLALDEDDGLIQRTLYEQKSLREIEQQKLPWFVFVYTGSKKNAGTNANVSMVVYGDNGKSDQISLANNNSNFKQGATDEFKINMIDIGIPYKIRIWHNNSGSFSGWFLEKVELRNIATKKEYVFYCNRWLATDEDDNQILRELPATGEGIKKPLPVITYKVEVYTGDILGAGTDANIFLNILGVFGDTGERFLTDSKTNKNKFERRKMDEFQIEAVTLMELKKIRIGHHSKHPGSGWYLNKVIITPSNDLDHSYTFECNRWLAVDEDDGATIREIFTGGFQMLKATTYNIQIKTGDVRGAGTDANVFIKIFGIKDDTEIFNLTTAENHTNKFERGHIDMFKINAADIGEIKKIKIGHDNSFPGAGWFLDKVKIDIPSKGEYYIFACHRWLDTDEDDGQTELFLKPSKMEKREKYLSYEVTVWTGNKNGAGTDANVFIRLFGKKGKTEKYFLRNKNDNFEAGMIDKFKIETRDVGQLLKIQVGHDGKGAFSEWFLEKLLIRHFRTDKKQQKHSSYVHDERKQLSSRNENIKDKTGTKSQQSAKKVRQEDEKRLKDDIEEYWFFVNQWFSKHDDDNGALIKEFVPTDAEGKPLPGMSEEIEYTVKVVTGDVMGAGTDANVFVNIYGELGDSADRQLSKSDNLNKFERNQEDVFTLKAVDLGKLLKLKIYHDNKGGGAAWFLNHVEVINSKTKDSYLFPCQRWLSTKDDDGQISRELVPLNKRNLDKSGSIREEAALETKAAVTTFYIKVITGNVWGAGTDANVFIILYGDIDNTGQVFLKSSLQSKNKFERGNTDEFVLEAVNIGELKKIKIGHDNASYGGAWFLEKVIIDCPSLGKTWTFPCGRWLALDKDDGKLEKELYPQEMATEKYIPCIPYEITTYTGDVSGASTDADVFIVLYGKTSSTQQKFLCANKKERKQRFKRNGVDKFVIEVSFYYFLL
ncbi:unnamed protein product [Acanthosepion pharaonis]|uniref:PLAT domain-containing protein n=1 Tax=Acanthosepion pharaonis TaxID=158019 RepID=A0A812CT41_ACAPH|nr:unnamed protein product [Sepia pharaonis]